MSETTDNRPLRFVAPALMGVLTLLFAFLVAYQVRSAADHGEFR